MAADQGGTPRRRAIPAGREESAERSPTGRPPAWIDSAHFDIEAKPETEIPRNQEGYERRTRTIQALIVDRFGMEFHRETKELPIYALGVAKGGPKLVSGVAGESAGGSSNGRGKLQGRGLTTAALAEN